MEPKSERSSQPGWRCAGWWTRRRVPGSEAAGQGAAEGVEVAPHPHGCSWGGSKWQWGSDELCDRFVAEQLAPTVASGIENDSRPAVPEGQK